MVEWEEEGHFDDALRQRIGKPFAYAEEGVVYNDHAWSFEDAKGMLHGGYEVVLSAIDGPLPVLSRPSDGLSAELLDEIEETPPAELVRVMIRTAPPPSPDLLLLPPPDSVSAEDYALALQELEEQTALDDAAYAEAVAPLSEAIEAAGGTVKSTLASIAWLLAEIPAGALVEVGQRPDVLAIVKEGSGGDGACHDPHGQAGDPVPLGELRVLSRADDWLNAGYHGQPASGEEILVGIHEGGQVNSDACFFADLTSSCNASQRLEETFDCNSSGCTPTTSTPSPTRHATNVASIILGDYSQNQGQSYETQIAGSSPPTNWRDLATAAGTEVEAHSYAVGSLETAKIKAYECARDRPNADPSCEKMDILHAANGVASQNCSASPTLPIEDAAEKLADNGVLPVIISHNHSVSGDTCRVQSPADIPKVFTVGGLEPSESASYHDWPIFERSNRGGGPIRVGFTTYPEALSMVDLTASAFPGFVTEEGGTYGTLAPDGPCVGSGGAVPTENAGTSFAGPQVAAAAALVKHYFINQGHSWIENPHRLHAVMLAMGDRATNTDPGAAGPTRPACIDGDQINCGADFYFGMGRLRLDFPTPFTYWNWNITSSGWNKSVIPASGLMGTGTRMLKCVMHQVEDMSNKDDIADMWLTVNVRDQHPTHGCQTGHPGTFRFGRTDNSRDTKKMVSIDFSDVSLENRCLEVTWRVFQVNTAGKARFITYCHADAELETEGI